MSNKNKNKEKKDSNFPVVSSDLNDLLPANTFVSDNPISFFFDTVKKCSESCKIYEICTMKRVGEKCQIERLYIATAMKPIYDELGTVLTSFDKIRLGLHLTPLYQLLARLQKESITQENVAHSTDSGLIRIHPIYKEIRETIKIIDDMWSTLKLDEKLKELNAEKTLIDGTMVGPDMIEGDGGIYDVLENSNASPNDSRDVKDKDKKEDNAKTAETKEFDI